VNPSRYSALHRGQNIFDPLSGDRVAKLAPEKPEREYVLSNRKSGGKPPHSKRSLFANCCKQASRRNQLNLHGLSIHVVDAASFSPPCPYPS
jgi:hypothetical protein